MLTVLPNDIVRARPTIYLWTKVFCIYHLWFEENWKKPIYLSEVARHEEFGVDTAIIWAESVMRKKADRLKFAVALAKQIPKVQQTVELHQFLDLVSKSGSSVEFEVFPGQYGELEFRIRSLIRHVNAANVMQTFLDAHSVCNFMKCKFDYWPVVDTFFGVPANVAIDLQYA